uniref:uronyl 2-sulfotransferase-like n=1 Tax=Styela clava TaxID=7725 RepID=UPI00193A43AA|nr:uronyl 2-sulfotransferase-like [Styela clava]
MISRRNQRRLVGWFLLVMIFLCANYFFKEKILSIQVFNKQTPGDFENVANKRNAQNDDVANFAKSPLVKNARSSIVVYNRAPKCGSRSMMYVISELAVRNNFTDYESRNYSARKLEGEELQHQVDKIASLRPPVIYNRHLNFIDFRKYGYKQPIYINLIRDPLSRFVSHYNYMKYGDEVVERKMPEGLKENINDCVMLNHYICRVHLAIYEWIFFCGMENTCNVNTVYREKRFEIIKEHIEKEYLIIGISEEFENSLKLFEILLPEYFTGASDIWKRHNETRSKTATKKHDILTEEAENKMRNVNLVDSYRLYNIVKKKFNQLKEKYGIK